MKRRKPILRGVAVALFVVLLIVCAGCSSQPDTLHPGSQYVTETCLYMSPLNAVFREQDDNGYRYCIEETAFTWHRRDNPAAGSGQIDNVHWGWQSFPYTDAEWNAMLESNDLFNHAAIENINAQYDHPLYQPLSDQLFLLQLNGEIWLVSRMPLGSEDNPWQIVSIHTLMQEPK